MRSYFDRLSALIGSSFRLASAEMRHHGATSHARRRSDTLEAAPAGCARPSDVSPEPLRSNFGSKTTEFHRENK